MCQCALSVVCVLAIDALISIPEAMYFLGVAWKRLQIQHSHGAELVPFDWAVLKGWDCASGQIDGAPSTASEQLHFLKFLLSLSTTVLENIVCVLLHLPQYMSEVRWVLQMKPICMKLYLESRLQKHNGSTGSKVSLDELFCFLILCSTMLCTCSLRLLYLLYSTADLVDLKPPIETHRHVSDSSSWLMRRWRQSYQRWFWMRNFWGF